MPPHPLGVVLLSSCLDDNPIGSFGLETNIAFLRSNSHCKIGCGIRIKEFGPSQLLLRHSSYDFGKWKYSNLPTVVSHNAASESGPSKLETDEHANGSKVKIFGQWYPGRNCFEWVRCEGGPAINSLLWQHGRELSNKKPYSPCKNQACGNPLPFCPWIGSLRSAWSKICVFSRTTSRCSDETSATEQVQISMQQAH